MITHQQLQGYVDRVSIANDGKNDGSFHFSSGSRMFKVINTYENGQEVVHCFVDKETGDIFKAESWYKPAKGKRGNIFDDNPPVKLGDYYL